MCVTRNCYLVMKNSDKPLKIKTINLKCKMSAPALIQKTPPPTHPTTKNNSFHNYFWRNISKNPHPFNCRTVSFTLVSFKYREEEEEEVGEEEKVKRKENRASLPYLSTCTTSFRFFIFLFLIQVDPFFSYLIPFSFKIYSIPSIFHPLRFYF